MNDIKIIKSSTYKKEYKKKLENKHLNKEIDVIRKIERLIIETPNMKELMLNPLHIVYGIEKKSGDLKEIYTARLNQKLRLYIKPDAEYPYDNLEQIVELEFVKIDDKHYGDG
ncbi:MAG: hypothetical protein J6A15_08500 [Clostridia bacterium]|nr:hypothetical protein [Clostridia bacterium]